MVESKRPLVPYYLLKEGKPAVTHRTRLRFDLARLNRCLHGRTLIPHPYCMADDCIRENVPETPEHVLLACPRYQLERVRLEQSLASLGVEMCLPVLLSDFDSVNRSKWKEVLKLTSSFICSVQRRRNF
jgi:hypothetical protein